MHSAQGLLAAITKGIRKQTYQKNDIELITLAEKKSLDILGKKNSSKQHYSTPTILDNCLDMSACVTIHTMSSYSLTHIIISHRLL